MPTRIPLAILVLAALFVCSISLAVQSDPVGLKVEDPQAGSEVAAPATTEWGMMVMVLLVLTATTAAMLGGGFPGGVERARPTLSRPAAPAPPEESLSPKAAASPKNKSKRPFSYRRVFRSHGHQEGHGGRRNSLQRTRRRREGPGCRGIR